MLLSRWSRRLRSVLEPDLRSHLTENRVCPRLTVSSFLCRLRGTDKARIITKARVIELLADKSGTCACPWSTLLWGGELCSPASLALCCSERSFTEALAASTRRVVRSWRPFSGAISSYERGLVTHWERLRSERGVPSQERGPVILASGGFGADFTQQSLLVLAPQRTSRIRSSKLPPRGVWLDRGPVPTGPDAPAGTLDPVEQSCYTDNFFCPTTRGFPPSSHLFWTADFAAALGVY